MGKFIIQRLLWILPTIFLALLVVFGMTKLVPGDPVIFYLDRSQEESFQDISNVSSLEYQRASKTLGFDLPVFYISIQPSYYPEDYYLVPYRQKFLARYLLNQTKASWEDIDSFFILSEKLIESVDPSLGDIQHALSRFIYTPKGKNMPPAFLSNPGLTNIVTNPAQIEVHNLQKIYDRIADSKIRPVSILPRLYWHGSQNQFHQWFLSTCTFDFGQSLQDGQSVATKIFNALRWTLVINIISILIAYFLAIIIGVYSAYYENSWFDYFTSYLLYLAYAIPVFWMATLFVVFFSTSEFGAWTNIFPSVGIWNSKSEDTFLQILFANFNLFWIPIICLSTSLMAFIARQVHGGIMQEKNKKYVVQARAKGISEHRILWRHIFKNASFPLITMIAGILPASISGSLVLEVICSIPGMGRLMYDSILSQDWPIVISIVYIGILLTITGLLISDILYQYIHPKVKLGRR